jgi:hypothetical protein
MTKVTLYEHENFGGENIDIFTDDSTLANDPMHWFLWWVTATWDNNASSMIVSEGEVTVYDGRSYTGQSGTFGEGEYASLSGWEDKISSMDLWG